MVADEPAQPSDARPFLPAQRSLLALRDAATRCRGCHLWRGATQTVFGEGPADARVMLVGEMPADHEDRAGRPFVGPAGLELDRALAAAGIDRADLYITNVVKHFSFAERGTRRIHQTPKRLEVEACRPWLDRELEAVRPEVLVLVGATALRALLGRGVVLRDVRGRPLPSELAPLVAATIHPASILRHRDDAERDAERRGLARDLQRIVEMAGGAARTAPRHHAA